MKILLYGEAFAKGTGAWCYAEAIRALGFDLIIYDDYTSIKKYRKYFVWKVIRKLNHGVLLKFDRERHVNGLISLTTTELPDIIVILKGLFISETDVMKLQQLGSFVVNVNHDDFFSLNKNNISNIQYNAIKAYDYILTTRQVNVAEVRLLNNNVLFFPFSYNPNIHKVFTITKEDINKYDCDVLFIGTYERNRAKMLELLMEKHSFKLCIYGKGWERLKKNSVLKKYIKSYTGLWMEEMAKAIQVAKITLGFLRKENRDDYTQRSLEIPACGGLLLAERTDFHKKLFQEKYEAFFFDESNIQELGSIILKILSDQQELEVVRKRGVERIKELHLTYQDRVNQIIGLLKAK